MWYQFIKSIIMKAAIYSDAMQLYELSPNSVLVQYRNSHSKDNVL